MWPTGLAQDSLGNLFVADFSANVIRMIAPGGTITTVAGTGTAGYTGDGGDALAATLNAPARVNLDADGDLYISDWTNHVVRAVESLGTAATAPDAPTGVTATAGSGQADVSWTPPLSDGGSAITGYSVTPHDGATSLTPVDVSAGTTSTTVTGLTNGTSYTFTVTATNAAGTSADSAPSAAVTPATLPGSPTGVTATGGDAQADVSWSAPASDGGSPITGYTVTPHDGATSLTPVDVAAGTTSTTITGLTNGTTYTFTVTATNAVGTSPASAASNSVTPAAASTDGTITNGGFESGLTGWTTSGVRAPVASTTARTGTGSALLGVSSGSEPLGNSVLSQTIAVPATGTPTLSFWYKPHTTDEPCTGTACRYDWMEAQLRSTTGTVLQSLFKRASNSATWTRITADLSAYKGQNITLWFNVHLDGAVPADNTWMYLDDVTLTNTQTTTTAPAAFTGLSAPAGNSAGSLQGLSRREVAPGILRN
jgi:hypothetical protein